MRKHGSPDGRSNSPAFKKRYLKSQAASKAAKKARRRNRA